MTEVEMHLMNGPIAQIVALALHGNAMLTGIPATNFLDQNSTAQFCQFVTFYRETPSWFGLGKPEQVAMSSPEQWFDDLKKRQAKRIGVRWTSGKESGATDRMLAAFVGGGGTWTLQVQLSDGNYEQWIAQWAVDESRRQKDGKIWKVAYKRVYVGKDSLPAVSLTVARAQLKQALTDIHAFASRTDAKPFTTAFAKALAALNEEVGSEAYHRDLFPEKTGTRSAVATLQAAQHVWVFGGMGSWNDLGFDGNDAKEYDRVSEQLYQALVHAIPAAVDDR
jgi:hypothetical protein